MHSAQVLYSKARLRKGWCSKKQAGRQKDEEEMLVETEVLAAKKRRW